MGHLKNKSKNRAVGVTKDAIPYTICISYIELAKGVSTILFIVQVIIFLITFSS
jgi:hypothetical protein